MLLSLEETQHNYTPQRGLNHYLYKKKKEIITPVLEKDKNLSTLETNEKLEITGTLTKIIYKYLDVFYFRGDELPTWKKREVHIPMKQYEGPI